MPASGLDDYFGLRTRLPLPLPSLIGVALALAAVAASAFFIYQSLQTRRVAADRVSHTLEVIQQLEGRLSTLKDAETGQRGFLLTGEERYLEPYTAAAAPLPGEIRRRCATLTGDNPQQLQRLDTLDAAHDGQARPSSSETIALRRAGDAAAGARVVRTDRGKASMDRVRADRRGDEARGAGAARRAPGRTGRTRWRSRRG